jgi:hypothetical protein
MVPSWRPWRPKARKSDQGWWRCARASTVRGGTTVGDVRPGTCQAAPVVSSSGRRLRLCGRRPEEFDAVSRGDLRQPALLEERDRHRALLADSRPACALDLRSAGGGVRTRPGSAGTAVVVHLAQVDWVTSAPQLPGHLVGGFPIVDDEQDLFPNSGPGAINESKTLHRRFLPRQSIRHYPPVTSAKRQAVSPHHVQTRPAPAPSAAPPAPGRSYAAGEGRVHAAA